MSERTGDPRGRSAALQGAARVALVPLVCLLLGFCQALAAAQDPPAPAIAAVEQHAHAQSGVRIAQAWIRWLPANLPAGGYLTLVNDRDEAVTLLAARSAAYASVALHRTLTAGGVTRMVPVAAITVPAHTTLDFAAHGYHLMLMQPLRTVKPGMRVPLVLQFAGGGILHVAALVRPPAAQPDSGRAMKGMPGMADMPGMSH